MMDMGPSVDGNYLFVREIITANKIPILEADSFDKKNESKRISIKCKLARVWMKKGFQIPGQ
jgi:hypothetical protein